VCAAPSSDGTAPWHEIVVSVANLSSTFLGGYWRYSPPTIASVAPSTLSPHPRHSSLTVRGTNLGAVPGTVTVGDVAVNCSQWSDAEAVCDSPRGVVPSAEVKVRTAGGVSSGANPPFGPVMVSYLPPVVLGVEAPLVPTRGNVTMRVWGTAFGTPLPVTLWLVPVPPSSALAWSNVSPWTLPTVIPCAVTNADVTDDARSSVTCTLSEGAGGSWSVVVVNHDVCDVWGGRGGGRGS
jgi:hypothetical protein